jgi:hypothetical protein
MIVFRVKIVFDEFMIISSTIARGNMRPATFDQESSILKQLSLERSTLSKWSCLGTNVGYR